MFLVVLNVKSTFKWVKVHISNLGTSATWSPITITSPEKHQACHLHVFSIDRIGSMSYGCKTATKTVIKPY